MTRPEDDAHVRPELFSLDLAARQRVAELVAVKGGHCDSCGGTEFEVGHALYMGFLFLDEDGDAYMVALTCRNPDCAQPRTGTTLHGKDFLTSDRDAAAAS